MNREAFRLYLVTIATKIPWKAFLKKLRRPAVQVLPSFNYEKKISPPTHTISWQNKSRK